MQICYIKPNYTTKPYYVKHKNKLMNKAYVSMLTCLYGITTSAAELEKGESKAIKTLDRIDHTCESALEVGQRLGYWVCVFMCMYEVVKKIKDGDTHAILGIILKYALAYGSIFIIRLVLDMIGEWF